MVTWDTAADWDGAESESGVVHEAVANTDHVDAGVVKQGYSITSPYFVEDLVGYWPLQEDSGGTAYDVSGNGNHGTVNRARQGAAGLLGTTAYAFEGSEHYVDLGFSSLSIPFTIVAWVYPTGSEGYVFSNYDASSDDCSLGIASGEWDFNADRASNPPGGLVTLGRWYHLVATLDASRLVLYVDGSEDHSGSGGTGVIDNGANFFIGDHGGIQDNNWDGTIADVRLYDRALSATEAETLHTIPRVPGTITTAPKEVQ